MSTPSSMTAIVTPAPRVMAWAASTLTCALTATLFTVVAFRCHCCGENLLPPPLLD